MSGSCIGTTIEGAGNKFSPEFISRVKKLIISTTHNTPLQNNDEKLICDIDLSSFALPWEEFLKDSHAVRAEHTSTPDKQFYLMKRDIADIFDNKMQEAFWRLAAEEWNCKNKK